MEMKICDVNAENLVLSDICLLHLHHSTSPCHYATGPSYMFLTFVLLVGALSRPPGRPQEVSDLLLTGTWIEMQRVCP